MYVYHAQVKSSHFILIHLKYIYDVNHCLPKLVVNTILPYLDLVVNEELNFLMKSNTGSIDNHKALCSSQRYSLDEVRDALLDGVLYSL